ncbi:MAG: carbohydrate-binding domain-containing protein [Clostridia bacterium]|nr:carbohydrate-binding domain-containing protein [Clostridia bacterium]
MKYSIAIKAACALLATALLASCGGGDGDETTIAGGEAVIESGDVRDNLTAADMPTVPETQSATVGSYTPTGRETMITLSGNSAEIDGDGASFADGELRLAASGTYILTGSLDGKVTVDTTDESKILLVLNGADVRSSDSPAIFVKSLPKKLVIFTAQDSVNILSDGDDYVVPDEEQTEGEIYPNACIYSCEDLTLDGEGTLYVYGNADKGINTKDDLEICDGRVIVESVGVGVRGNDSITAEGGEVYVSAGADGVKSANTDSGKGIVSLVGTDFYISCAGDGISSSSTLDVQAGKLVIQTRDADSSTENAALTDGSGATFEDLCGMGGMPPGGFGGGMGGGFGGGMEEGNSNKSTISAKGLKAVSTLTVSGGNISIESADDGIHSDDEVKINGGEIYISAADDGVHADNRLTVNNGIIEIAKSYEGVEAQVITVNDGVLRVTASDDGTNANGGTQMGGWGYSDSYGPSESEISPTLYINGGYTVLNAEGDGLDSNGCVYMTGGVVIVYGPTNGGNGAIDYGDARTDTFVISGGTLLAVGSSGMAQSATGDGQGVIFGNMRSALAAGNIIGVLDSDGKVLAAYKLPKAISSVVFSSPDVKKGDTYTVVYGGEYDGDDVDGVLTGGSYKNYSTLGTATAS